MQAVLSLVVAETYRSLARAGLVLGAEGSVAAADRAAGAALVTGGGLVASEARREGVAEVDLRDGAVRSGPVPSPHLPIHLALLTTGGLEAAVVVRSPY